MGMGKLLNLLVIKNKKHQFPFYLFAHFYSDMIQNVFVFFAFLINGHWTYISFKSKYQKYKVAY